MPDAPPAGQLVEWLLAEGFKFEGYHGDYRSPWFIKGLVRVVIDDEHPSVYAFDPAYPKALILAWSATFANAPFGVVRDTVRNALDSVRARLIPQD